MPCIRLTVLLVCKYKKNKVYTRPATFTGFRHPRNTLKYIFLQAVHPAVGKRGELYVKTLLGEFKNKANGHRRGFTEVLPVASLPPSPMTNPLLLKIALCHLRRNRSTSLLQDLFILTLCACWPVCMYTHAVCAVSMEAREGIGS